MALPSSSHSVQDTSLPQTSTAPTRPQSYTYYHAGPLFTISDLFGNTLLSQAIKRRSSSKFSPHLPQDLEQRDNSPHSIRDQDIRALLSSDLALFVYDGSELDSGTVVEFMLAKMADIPAVILRTDFRKAGDQGTDANGQKGDPWNLMSSFYPRVETVIIDGMTTYKASLAYALGSEPRRGSDDLQTAAGVFMVEDVADSVIDAMTRVVQIPPALPPQIRENVYEWLGVMPNFRDEVVEGNVSAMLRLCRDKADKGLL